MTGELINQVVRAVVLLGLLLYFVVSLGRGLIEDERRLGFGPLRTGTGEDPGIRVLLENRQPPEPARTWENTINVTVLEAVDVVTPNIPDDATYRLKLHAGAMLSIQPDTNRG